MTAAAGPIKEAAEALAALDVAAALAQLAVEQDYVRPEVDGSLDFVIEGGRHPVVEQALVADGGPFVANDCDLSAPPSLPASEGGAGRICLLTGPNMAGKSTFLRQNALIAILAQMGSFVPARRARIGVVDRLFSRVGAADDLARGRSTFMVEMVETAAILNQAGERSLVILDEIGRGTATFDGLSIAWATIEHLHAANRCRALFATHFHELTVLATKLPRLFNATVRVKEWQGEVVFLHEVVPGAADRSYGIQVAKLAGLPASVIERAKLVLAKLEAEDRAAPRGFDDLPLFAATAPPTAAEAARSTTRWRKSSPRSPRSIPTRCRRARRWRRSTPSRQNPPPKADAKPAILRSPITRRRRWRAGGHSACTRLRCVPARPTQQAYPTRPITIIVPAAPGGVSDSLARAVGQRLSEAWGQQVIVENRGGANHQIGAAQVAKAPRRRPHADARRGDDLRDQSDRSTAACPTP